MSPRILASFAALAAPVLAAGLCACGLFFPTMASEAQGPTGDGGGDVTVGGDATNGLDGGMAAKDFSISVSPSYAAIAPGQSVQVTVNVQRFGAFTGEVDITLGLPPYVSPGSITTFITGANTTFSLTSMVAAPPALAQMNALGDFPLMVTGKTPSGSETATAPLTVHLSGLLATFDTPGDGGAALFNVPSNVPLIRVKAWGAGGGSGPPPANCTPGCLSGAGGGGGFVLADVPVKPNEILAVIVGAAGLGSPCNGFYGGEYSAVMRGIAGGGASSSLVIAGGGGGGGTWSTAACQCSGGGGGAGGGVHGENGGQGGICGLNGCMPAAPGGGGATQTADGVAGGGFVCGGGGLHNGGTGAFAAGGSCNSGAPGGGGGGSGGTDVYDAGIDVISNVTGSGTAPANTTDLDYGDASPGVGAPACDGTGSRCAQGTAGRVVILVP